MVLDGSASRDPDGRIVDYRWLQTRGEAVDLVEPDGARIRFEAPATSVTLGFALVVIDDAGATDRDDVEVRIDAEELPVADAGPDLEVSVDRRVQLDGTNSRDPDGRIVSHAWEQTRGILVELDDATSPEPSFAAPSTPSLLSFTLRIEDDDGNVATDEVVVAVRDNLSPRADAGPDQIAEAGEVVVLDGSGSSDPDGEIVAYAWSQVEGPTAALGSRDRAQANSVVPGEPGVVVVELTVTDDRGATASDRVLIIPSGNLPELRIAYPTVDADFEGRRSSTVVTGRVQDPDGTDIVEITVNGQPAELEPDDPTRFRGRAPVTPPRSTITVEATDQAGERTVVSRPIQSQISFGFPGAAALDATNDRIFVFVESGLIQLDRRTGDRSNLLSSAALEQRLVLGAVYDPSSDEIYAVGRNRNLIQAIDVSRGTVRIVSSVDVGSGPALDQPLALVLDPSRDRLLVDNRGVRNLLEVDLATGDRRELVPPPEGFTPPIVDGPFGLDPGNDLLYVAYDDFFEGAQLREVDLSTGQVRELGSIGFFLPSPPRALVFDPTTGEVVVSNGGEVSIYDPATDQWRVLVPREAVADFQGVALLDAEERILLFAMQERVTVLDLETADIAITLQRSVGSGPRFWAFNNDLHHDVESETLYLLAESREPTTQRRVYSVDPRGGDRAFVGDGALPLRTDAESAAYDPIGDRVLVADQFAGLWSFEVATDDVSLVEGGGHTAVTTAPEVEQAFVAVATGSEVVIRSRSLRTGESVVLSGPTVGSGPALEGVFDLAYDRASDRLFVLDRAGLFALDLSTKARRRFGSQDLFETKIDVDTHRGRLLVLRNDEILAYDLETGRSTPIGPIPSSRGLAVSSEDQVAFTVRRTPGREAGLLAVELGSGEWVECSR